MPPDLDSLIDNIYEAALFPELWTSVLHAITDLAEGAFASLFVQSRGELRWIGTPEADVLIADYVALGRPDFNSRIGRAKRLNPVGFISDQDIFSSEEMDNDPFYTEFLRPRGYGWVADSHIVSPSSEMILISSERRFARPLLAQRPRQAQSAETTSCPRNVVIGPLKLSARASDGRCAADAWAAGGCVVCERAPVGVQRPVRSTHPDNRRR